MTEKRFVSYFDKDHNYIIQDLQNEDEYQVGFVNCDEDIFLKLVNKIVDENKQLKIFLKAVNEELDLANRDCDILEEENEQLKQQKEVWKQHCCTYSNFNSILLHELDIAQEQGFKVSNPFKQFLEDRGDVE